MAERQRGIIDAIGDMLGPKQAEAAPWKDVVKLLTKLKPIEMKALDKTSLRAMEHLTERFPAVKRVPVDIAEQYPTPYSVFQSPATWPSIEQWVTGKVPFGVRRFGRIKLNPAAESVAMDYAHEAGHAFAGPTEDWVRKEATILPARVNKFWTPDIAGSEGFAEGISNALLNRFGKSADTYYWPRVYKEAPTWLQKPYNEAGYLGRDVGSDLRKGKSVDQQSMIEELIKIINRYND